MKYVLIILAVMILISCGTSTAPENENEAPANLTAFTTMDNYIQLNWEDRSSEELGFVIERSDTNREFVIIDTTVQNLKFFIDQNVVPGNSYSYRIFAWFEDSISEYSNEVSIELTACSPTDLTVFMTSSYTVQLNWEDRSLEELNYVIQRKDNNSQFATIDTIAADSESYIDNTVIVDNNYTFRVAALMQEGLSSWSNEAEVEVCEWYSGLNFGEEETFDIITWNIQFFPLAGATTVEYVSKMMLVLDAEIYALQEIEDNDSFNDLVDAMNYLDVENSWQGIKAQSAAYDVNLAYIYKENDIQVDVIQEIYSSYSYSRPFPRRPLLMEMIFQDHQLYIINNHLKASGDGVLNLDDSWDEETRRWEACNLLDEYITENLPNSNVIVLGDLNDELDDEEVNNVFMSFINEPSEYEFTDMPIAQGPFAFWSYPGWPSHLDHILITNELFDEYSNQNSTCETLRVDQFLDNGLSEYENYISDHRPVGMKLDLLN